MDTRNRQHFRSLIIQCVYLPWSGGREARAGIGEWTAFYNNRRPHSALGGRTPDAVYWSGNDQELIPSYRKLLWSKAMVVSVAEKSGR